MRRKREADPNVGLAAENGRRSGAVIESGCIQHRTQRIAASLLQWFLMGKILGGLRLGNGQSENTRLPLQL